MRTNENHQPSEVPTVIECTGGLIMPIYVRDRKMQKSYNVIILHV